MLRRMLPGIVIGLAGCLPGAAGDGDRLVVATSWPEAERVAIATAYSRWRDPEGGASAKIEWRSLAPGDDLSRVVPDRGPTPVLAAAPDVVLGGHATSYARLAGEARLVPIERDGRPAWCVARRSPIGRATNPSVMVASWTFDDPRHDPIALAWAKGRLDAGGWAAGYARLVRDAGSPRRIGRLAGSGLAAVERGDAGATPAIAAPAEPGGLVAFARDADAPEWVEGVAIAARTPPRIASAQRFLRFLAGRGQAEPPPEVPRGAPDAESLLADLLGATLVDAQPELRAAWAALGRAKKAERATMWMTQPPPWPPASVEKLIDRDGSGDLLQTLAAQVAPDPDVRAWLLRSWLGPRRLIDGAVLAELAGAVDGRLVRESRFRDWLRAEWTAWARQRYRRVAVLAGRAAT